MNKETTDLTNSHLRQIIDDFSSNFIYSKPKKLNFVVGKNGEKLSGGERQRLSILKSILKSDCCLWLFDEISTALDSRIDKKIKDSLYKMMKDKTVIMITHRLQKEMKNMDKIITIKDGKIVEIGNFETLIKQKGEFYKLWSLYNK